MHDRTPPAHDGRIRLTYPLEVYGETVVAEVPVVVGVLGDFGLTPPAGRPPLRDRRFKRLRVEDLHQLAALQGGSAPIQRLAPIVALAEANPWLRVRVLDVTRAEMAADFQAASVIDESALWRLVFDSEFRTFGGEPYAMLLVDFAFTADSADLDLLQNLARLGADAACAVIAAAAPRLFAAAQWDGLPDAQQLDALFATRPYAGWHALRDGDAARFLALTVFADAIGLGARLLRAYTATGLWTGAALGEGDQTRPVPDRQRDEALARHGFLLGHAALRDLRNAQRPRRFHQPEATALDALTARLAHVLTSSQFLRAVSCLARDAFGTTSMVDLEARLNRWLQDHVEDGAAADPHHPTALRPLAEAHMQLHDLVSAPGEIEAVLTLRINLPDVQSAHCARYAMRSFGYR